MLKKITYKTQNDFSFPYLLRQPIRRKLLKSPFPLSTVPSPTKKRSVTTNKNKQDQINGIAETQILQHVSSDYNAHAALEQRIDQITVLKKHLDTYTRRNTADFFIHKDLKQFLNRRTWCLYQKRSHPVIRFYIDRWKFRLAWNGASYSPYRHPNHWLPLPDRRIPETPLAQKEICPLHRLLSYPWPCPRKTLLYNCTELRSTWGMETSFCYPRNRGWSCWLRLWRTPL